MKIAIVCYPTFGGSGVLATELGKALSDKGHEIHLITYQQPVRLLGFHANLYYHEVRVPTYPLFDYPPYETALASTMVDVINKHNIDLLHVHYAIPHAPAAYMARQILKKQGRTVPFITTLHGTDITLIGKDPTYKPVVTFSMEESDALTAVSESLKNDTYKNFNLSKPIEVIYNFVDVERFRKKDVDELRKAVAPHGEKIIIHASNFRKVKRLEDVVEIFFRIEKRLSAKLLLIGDGPERQRLESLTRDYENKGIIRYLGKQEQIEDILPIGDLFLLPSETESFGLAALEAMAAGLPVISSDAGGLPELNMHGICGFMGKVGDVEDISQKALEILSDNSKLEEFRNRALLQAKNFDIKKIVPKYEELYEKVRSSASP